MSRWMYDAATQADRRAVASIGREVKGHTEMAINKKGNDYYLQAGRDVYEAIPKAVWAAIAISSLTCGGDQLDQARKLVLYEWNALAQNGIVPQKPAGPLATEANAYAWQRGGTE